MPAARKPPPSEPAGRLPLPGRPVRGSSTGRPIMAALDLLGRRWMLRVLWELRDGAVGFRDLRARCDQASPTVLHSRLSELKAAGLVAQNEARAYYLTPVGSRLYDSLKPLRRWAEEWSVEFGDDH